MAPLALQSGSVRHLTIGAGAFIELRPEPHGPRVVVVRSGLVKRFEIQCDGKEVIHDFDLPGAIIAVHADARTQLLEAIESTALCELDWTAAVRLVQDRIWAFDWLTTAVQSNLHSLETKLELLNERQSNLRLLRFLMNFARQRGLSPPVKKLELPITRQDMGCYLNMSAETVSRSFSALHEMKYLRMRGPRCIDLLAASAAAESARM